MCGVPQITFTPDVGSGILSVTPPDNADREITIREGSNLDLTCSPRSNSCGNNNQLEWTFNGMTNNGSNMINTIEKASRDNDGVYKCGVRESGVLLSTASSVKVTVIG